MIKRLSRFIVAAAILAAGSGCASTPESKPAASSTGTVPKSAEKTAPAPQTPGGAQMQKRIDAHVDQISQEKRSKFRLQSLFR